MSSLICIEWWLNAMLRHLTLRLRRISSVDVANLLPANGGRDAETVEEIVQRAPSLLTTRDGR